LTSALTIGGAVERIAEELDGGGLCFAHGADTAESEALLLVLGGLGLPLDPARVDADRELSAVERERIRGLLQRRLEERVPAAYLVGRAAFAGLEFIADPRALVPRSPIAELIVSGFAPWLDAGRLERVLDMCTGGGCIAVATAVHLPHVRVDAVDLSEEALALAAENVRLHGVGDRARLIRSDLFDALEGERYDLILANPPYVSREEFETLPPEHAHEPAAGLVAGRAGMATMLRLLRETPRHLDPGGRIIGEVGHSRAELEALLPGVEWIWPALEHGGEGVFLLEGPAVRAAATGAEAVLRGKE